MSHGTRPPSVTQPPQVGDCTLYLDGVEVARWGPNDPPPQLNEAPVLQGLVDSLTDFTEDAADLLRDGELRGPAASVLGEIVPAVRLFARTLQALADSPESRLARARWHLQALAAELRTGDLGEGREAIGVAARELERAAGMLGELPPVATEPPPDADLHAAADALGEAADQLDPFLPTATVNAAGNSSPT
jgi:hypothetical protein